MSTLERLELSPGSEEIEFDALVSRLEENMRQYDALMTNRKPLLDAQETMNDQFGEIDLELPVEAHPLHVAQNALEKLILDKKSKELDKEISELGWGYGDALELLLEGGLDKRLVEVIPLFPEKFRLDSITDYNRMMGVGTYLNSTKKSKKGKIRDINLDAGLGGFIVINTRFSTYKTGSLIDKESDYRPNYSIRFLD